MADTIKKISRINLKNGENPIDYPIDVAFELKDSTPTQGSLNVVTSDGIAQALELKLAKKPDGSNDLINEDGKINTRYLNDSVLGQVKFGGTWANGNVNQVSALLSDAVIQKAFEDYENPNVSKSDISSVTLNSTNTQISVIVNNIEISLDLEGFYFITSADNTFAAIDFKVGDWLIASGGKWAKVDNTDAVTSVNGQTGNVTIEQEQSDWNENDPLSAAYIKNRTHYVTNDNTVIQLDAKFIPVDDDTIKVENGKLVGATKLDLSNVDQDVNIVGDHNLSVSGDLNIEGDLSFGGDIEFQNIVAHGTISTAGIPTQDNDVINLKYLREYTPSGGGGGNVGNITTVDDNTNVEGNLNVTGDISLEGSLSFSDIECNSATLNEINGSDNAESIKILGVTFTKAQLELLAAFNGSSTNTAELLTKEW